MEKNKCKICETEFDAKVIGENHYITTDTTSMVLTGITTRHYYDAFDCPVCKCQNILGERKLSILSYQNDAEEKEVENYFDTIENKTLCDRCNKQDKECSCDCAREFEEKEENEHNIPKCFGNYFYFLGCCSRCEEKNNCITKSKEDENKIKKAKCFGNYDNENIVCVMCKCATECIQHYNLLKKITKEANINE